MDAAAYNLDVYERLVFRVPPVDRLRPVLLVGGALSGVVIYGIGRYRGLLGPAVGPALGLVVLFAGAPLLTALATRRFPDFPENWGYLLGLAAAAMGFVPLGLDLLVGPTDGWALTIVGAAFVLLTSMAALVLTAGTERWLSLVVASSFVPLAILLVPVAGAARFGGPPIDGWAAVGAVGVVSVGLGASVYVHERLIDANVTYIDGSRLTSTLLTDRREDIDAGYEHEPWVQTLRIEAAGEGFDLAIPWVHPGPIANFGGGAIADRIISRLNESGAGFFAKAPVTHEDDPAEGAVTDRVLAALPTPEASSEASRLLHRNDDGIDVHGRRYGDREVLWLEPDTFGDFPTSIIADELDPDTTVVIDRHAYEPGGDRGIRYGSLEAERIRETLDRFLSDLRTAELHPYRAGTAVDATGKQLCALVEEVDGQRTVLFGSNENEVSGSMRDLETEYEGRYDTALVFSTDTHHDLHDLAVRRPVDADRMRDVIRAADDALAPASAGVGAERAAPTRLLGREYYALQYTINYVLRSFTVSLVALYAAAVVAVLV